jgi:hypothetical protein
MAAGEAFRPLIGPSSMKPSLRYSVATVSSFVVTAMSGLISAWLLTHDDQSAEASLEIIADAAERALYRHPL